MQHIEDISVTYQENGIPILSKEQIEAIALNCMSYIDESMTISPQVVPLKPILEGLKKSTGLTWELLPINFDTKEMIYGLCDIKNYYIYIEKDLEHNSSMLLFTLAHEIGHFVLHRHRKIKLDAQHHMFTDTSSQLQMKETLHKPFDWLEWQANYFAASLLMPRQLFTNAVEVYLEKATISFDELSNPTFFHELLIYLNYTFGTSKTATTIRFNELYNTSLKPSKGHNMRLESEFSFDVQKSNMF